MVFTWYDIVMTREINAKAAKRKERKNSVKEMVALCACRILQVLWVTLSFAFAIGGITILAVAKGMYVQPWWRPFVYVTLGVVLLFAGIIAVGVVMVLIYGLSVAMGNKMLRISRKMRRVYQGEWIRRAKVFFFIADVVLALRDAFCSFVKAVYRLSNYATWW